MTTETPATGPEPTRPHHNALPAGTRLGEFEIVSLVGEGGFGIVYLAQDHSLHRKVALKEYMPSLLAARGEHASVSVRSERQRETFELGLRSFVNEARMLAQFDHPALVKVYRFWEAHGTAYMVMPFYGGKTLQDVLRERSAPPDEAWIRALIGPLMDALAVLHAENVYHRDIAPDNVMLLADERPVLLDFGAARKVITDMTQALTVILKPGYAPIEQYADMSGAKQGPWTDVYALAAVVYFMITGKKPPPAVSRLMGDSYEPLMASAFADRYSAALLQGIDACLHLRPEDRPRSMAAMREAIGVAGGVTVGVAVGPTGAEVRAATGHAGVPTPAPSSTAPASDEPTAFEKTAFEKAAFEKTTFEKTQLAPRPAPAPSADPSPPYEPTQIVPRPVAPATVGAPAPAPAAPPIPVIHGDQADATRFAPPPARSRLPMAMGAGVVVVLIGAGVAMVMGRKTVEATPPAAAASGATVAASAVASGPAGVIVPAVAPAVAPTIAPTIAPAATAASSTPAAAPAVMAAIATPASAADPAPAVAAASAPPAATRRPTVQAKAAPPAQPAKKAPDAEREYMKRLNKDLDSLLGK